MRRLKIGIDPGVKTGYAESENGKILFLKSGKAVEIEQRILTMRRKFEVELLIEDARKRTWFGDRAKFKAQGAGSIKRDSQRWEEFAKYHKIIYRLVAPKHNRTKLKAEEFQTITGYLAKTNEHSRDAAMLVCGLT